MNGCKGCGHLTTDAGCDLELLPDEMGTCPEYYGAYVMKVLTLRDYGGLQTGK